MNEEKPNSLLLLLVYLAKYRFTIYALISVILTSMLAAFLGVNTSGVRTAIILITVAASIGGIRDFFYFFVLTIAEFVVLLIMALITKQFSLLLLPLVPLCFFLLTFISQVCRQRKIDRMNRFY